MADAKEIVLWILSNAGPLKLKIDQLSWVRSVLPRFTDLRVQVSIGGKIFTGFSADEDADLALVKATAEAVERAVSEEFNFPTTNGLAAHATPEAAAASARGELIERDGILCHFYGERPFVALSKDVPQTPLIRELTPWFADKGISFQLFELGTAGVLWVIDGREYKARPFGFILGAGNKSTPSESLTAAAFEATRQLAHLLESDGGLTGKSLEDFLRIPNPTFRDHGNLALNLAYAARIEHLFKPAEAKPSFAMDAEKIKTEMITSKSLELAGCPLYFARAQSSGAQDLFLGAPNSRNLNVNRIAEFLGTPRTFVQLPKLPHPFN